MKLIITRPRIDAAGLAEKLHAIGHSTIIAPLLDIVPRAAAIPDLPYQAICTTSANGLRCLSASINLQIPVFAVGEQSAAVAHQKGFHCVEAGGGDVEGLVRHIEAKLKPKGGPLLYLSGAETSGDLEGQLAKRGYHVSRVITYDALKCKLDEYINAISSCEGVLLYSPRTAKLWIDEIQRLKLLHIINGLRHFCLSAQVAKVLPQNWHVFVAKMPTENSLLALLDLTREAE